jgi:hypothetical protein
VNYEVLDGTAQHGTDFYRIAGTLVIPASSGGARIFVTIKGDIVPEGNESFTLRLTGAVNGTIPNGVVIATGTIVDDDKRPSGPSQP